MPALRSLLLATLSVLTIAVLLATCRRDLGPRTPIDPAPPEPSAPPVFAIASGTPAVLVGAGDIASCSKTGDEATANLLDTIPGTVFTLGDNASPNGSSSDYSNCYNPTWGRQRSRTNPSPGDLEYNTANASGYFGYYGAAAGDSSKGYYSYDLGDWHVVVLNSNISMSAGAAQEQWLKSDLAASTKQCTLAYWHHPRFYSGVNTVRSSVKPLWDDLYAAGAELVLNAHTGNYERFAPQSPDGTVDPDYGIREIIAGTGGLRHFSFTNIAPNSEVRDNTAYGVLKLTLNADTYTWQFIPAGAGAFTDAGSGSCHPAPAPVAKPGGPYGGEAGSPMRFDGSGSYDLQGDTPLVYAWDFGDSTTGLGAKPSHAYALDGTYTVALTITDSKGNPSRPATTSATIRNWPPLVDAGGDWRTHPGEPVQVTFSFSDPGNDAPWTYAVDWGDGTSDNGSAVVKGSVTLTHSYTTVGTTSARVMVTDAGGASGSDSLAVLVEPPGTVEVFIGAGDIASCANNRDELTAEILDTIPGTVYTVGDDAYPNGATGDYTNCYAPTWGRHRDRTKPALGNHEYYLGNADASFDYWGPRIGLRGNGYYSFDLGDWHIIVLNDNNSYVPVTKGSAQELWLKADLAASTKQCTLAIWHQPLYYSWSQSGTSYLANRKQLWLDLYAAGAEIVLNGHQHMYERFAPQTPDSVADPVRGIREFIVGTGGESSVTPTSSLGANSEVRGATFGVLKLELGPGSYTWEFIPITGQTFTDSGTGTCH